jgi:hypothetical protein
VGAGPTWTPRLKTSPAAPLAQAVSSLLRFSVTVAVWLLAFWRARGSQFRLRVIKQLMYGVPYGGGKRSGCYQQLN